MVLDQMVLDKICLDEMVLDKMVIRRNGFRQSGNKPHVIRWACKKGGGVTFFRMESSIKYYNFITP
jgi:hypothetical protein